MNEGTKTDVLVRTQGVSCGSAVPVSLRAEPLLESSDDERKRKRRLAQYKSYRDKNRESRNAKKKEWVKCNRERVKAYQAEWTARQPKRFWMRWPSRPPQKDRKTKRPYAVELAENRKRRKKQTEQMSDSYLRGWMSRTTGYRIKPGAWPAAFIELLRAKLKLKRLWQNQKTSTNSETNS